MIVTCEKDTPYAWSPVSDSWRRVPAGEGRKEPTGDRCRMV